MRSVAVSACPALDVPLVACRAHCSVSAKASAYNAEQVFNCQKVSFQCKLLSSYIIYGLRIAWSKMALTSSLVGAGINNYTQKSGNQYTFNSSCTQDGKRARTCVAQA